jgi:hypothetical protein
LALHNETNSTFQHDYETKNEEESKATNHHSAGLLSFIAPPLVLSTAWANLSPAGIVL